MCKTIRGHELEIRPAADAETTAPSLSAMLAAAAAAAPVSSVVHSMTGELESK